MICLTHYTSLVDMLFFQAEHDDFHLARISELIRLFANDRTNSKLEIIDATKGNPGRSSYACPCSWLERSTGAGSNDRSTDGVIAGDLQGAACGS